MSPTVRPAKAPSKTFVDFTQYSNAGPVLLKGDDECGVAVSVYMRRGAAPGRVDLIFDSAGAKRLRDAISEALES